MYPNESSSDEISSNIALQNFKDNVLENVPEQIAESQTTGVVNSNEGFIASSCQFAQLNSTFPTDQVPVVRVTHDCISEGTQHTHMAAVKNSSELAPDAQMIESVCTSQHSCWYSKDQSRSPCFSLAAMTILKGGSEICENISEGCKHCDPIVCHPKSEALCQESPKEAEVEAGADLTSFLSSEAKFSKSVISSSSCGTAEPPSLATSHGVKQGINAMSSRHLGSSNCNSLSNCAQSLSNSFINAITVLANDEEPTHVTQAIENPNTNDTDFQSEIAVHSNQLQDSVNWRSVKTIRNLETTMIDDNIPHTCIKCEVASVDRKEKEFSSGAISEPQILSNFPKGCKAEMANSLTLYKNAVADSAWSSTPDINIPKIIGNSVPKENLFLESAINSTVQGNNDSNPPQSFNMTKIVSNCNSFNNKNNVNIATSNANKCQINQKLLFKSANQLQLYYACKQTSVGEGVYDGPASNVRWGIPSGMGLRGGGESSLNSGSSSWGTPQGGNSNNSAWGGGNQNQGNTPTQNQWGNNSSNNNNANNLNRNNTGSGGGGAAGGAVGSGTSQTSAGQQNSGNSGKTGNSQPGQSTSQQPAAQTPNPQQQQQQQQSSQQSTQQSSQTQNQQNGSTSWAQAAGKGLPANQQNPSGSNGNGSGAANGSNGPSSSNNSNTSSNAGNSTANSTTNSSSSTKQQLEQLNTMREALYSQDGWGGQHVNQDTGWDIPASPEPVTKDGVPVWKPNVNNGTDLWEANLRNGGQPPPSQTQKTPWGHTPTSNIGGTWGEDDDVGDSSNVWTGVPSNTGPGTSGGQWGSNAAGPSGGMWGGAANWGDPRDLRNDPRNNMDPRGDPRSVPNIDPRDIRGGGGVTGDPRELRGGNTMMDPHLRSVVDPMRTDSSIRDPRDIRGMGDIRAADPIMRGPPSSLSVRLNGAGGDAMWGQHAQPPHHHGPHHQPTQPQGKMVGPGGLGGSGVNQWAGPPPKDLGLSGGSGKPSGWEEPSPPAQRRNLPNYDDGTSLWGNPAQQRNNGAKVSHWKEMPAPNVGRGGIQCPPSMLQNRMPGSGATSMKQDGGPLWTHPGRNGSWGDGPHDNSNAGWTDDKPSVGINSWCEPPLTPNSWGGPKPKNPLNPTGWVDGDIDATAWMHTQKGPKPISKDIVWASKQFKLLAEMGFKKEDIETALRNSNMNFDDAHELLNNRLNMENWRRHEDHSTFDLPSNHPSGGFPGQRFNQVAQQMPFAAPPGPNNAPSLINNPGGLNNISPAALMQKPPPVQPSTQHATQAFGQTGARTAQNQPSTTQLRMLVQQIQMAVQDGYLNHQILNQPLAPQTLILLNQLLQQIKLLHQLMQQQTMVQVHKGNSSQVLQMSVQITKTKQQIQNLQNQIASQQAIYVKQQQQQHHHHMAPQGPGSQSSDFFKPSVHETLAGLPSNFTDLTIKDSQVPSTFQNQQSQSRLNQWKLPSLDKDGDSGNNEFSRAPGTTAKPSLPPGHSSPNMNPLLGQGDGPWSSVSRANTDTGWPDTSSGDGNGQPDSKDPWPVTSQAANAAALADLVPEFEPGKPWKGTTKNIEDDPTITPGSVVRSPLSLPTLKDTEIFTVGSKTSPTVSSTVDAPVGLSFTSSSTWSFNPPPTTSSLGKLVGSKGSWGDTHPPTAVTSELWGAPVKPGRPPPGLSNKGGTPSSAAGTSSSNGWGALGGRSTWGIQGNTWSSTWLLLKNLTPQIDGSTLKTLCLQHGPLQNFHLYLNHGFALAKYSSREEANKAQGALNNCVLGNTTIFAESPGDSDVHGLLQHLGHGGQQQPSGGSANNWSLRGNSTPSTAKVAPTSDTWAAGSSQLWPTNPPTNSLWTPLDTTSDQHRATPSSLNSFLPGDLLGGESM